jgi:hypothetical protein
MPSFLSIKFSRLSQLIVVSSAIFLASSCSPVKQLPEGSYLLNKNTIKNDQPQLNEPIGTILKQKPNRRILGLFRFHLGAYTIANTGQPTGFKNWIKRAIGEAPVILDSSQTKRSSMQITQFMQNEGFFNATVTDSTVFKRKRKANVIYTIRSGTPYTIDNVEFVISDPVVKQIVLMDSSSTRLKKGNIFKTSDFTAERERITLQLKNIGYYEFNPSYISFDVDSSLGNHKADVVLNISGTDATITAADTCCPGLHKLYRIKDVYIQTDYDPISKRSLRLHDTIPYKNYNFLSAPGKPNFKYDALIPRIFIEKGNLFKINNSDFTYRSLTSLSTFRFVNIRYEITKDDSVSGNWLNSYIELSPAPRQDYKFEVEGTHNGGNLGVGGSLTYRNKNTFRGAESLEIGLRAKAERIPEFVEQELKGPFNSIELGPELSIRIPRMLWPVKSLNKSRSANPVTVFKTQYNYQQRPEYIRHLLVFSTGIEFRETKYKRHFIYPAEINYSNFNLTNAFREKLRERDDPRLDQYYQNILITNGRYAFIYNSQEQGSLNDFMFFRFTMEVAGNSMRLYDKLTRSNYRDTTSYDLLGISYSQYVLPEVDFRYYQVFDEHNMLVYRFNAGMGISYLNSAAMPYEKTFFAGGSNDLRAFRVRTIGPGSFDSEEFIESVGDIKINFNAEIRSDIFKFLEGAAFIDAGNVWLRKTDRSQPGGRFRWENAINELALGTGLGIRLDLTFFVIRLDAGAPLRNPAMPLRKRWVINNYKLKDTVLNLGIGYPF